MAIRAVTFGIFKVFDRVWHAALHHKLKSYVISGHVFGLVSSLLSYTRLRVILDGKSLQDLILELQKAASLVLHLFSILMTFLVVLSVILLCYDDTTLYSKCDLVSDLW